MSEHKETAAEKKEHAAEHKAHAGEKKAHASDAQHAKLVHHLATMGIPWPTLLSWIEQYGFPLLIQILPTIEKLIQGHKFNLAQILAWVEAALTALAAGQPLPPLPDPAS